MSRLSGVIRAPFSMDRAVRRHNSHLTTAGVADRDGICVSSKESIYRLCHLNSYKYKLL